MSEEDAFLRTIQASPADETARLVYADWLQERDDPRAEFVRVEFALAAMILAKERDDALAARYLDLALALDERWVTVVDRVPELLRPSVKAFYRDWVTPRTPWWMMSLLTGLFGEPVWAGELEREAVARAVAENRVVCFDYEYDSFVGDQSRATRPGEDDQYPMGEHTELVFPCVITDAILRRLGPCAFTFFAPDEVGLAVREHTLIRG